MPYEAQQISYRYKHVPMHSDVTMLYVSVTGEAIAPLEGDQQLWAIFLANAIKKHGKGKTFGTLRIDNQSYVPEPKPGKPISEWNSFKQFNSDRPAEDVETWPTDSGSATR